ncbi:MAG: alpha/beta hydrolase [Bacteroidetes bacterium]|uniref:alpha/beta hydrolase n=1 Tax=Flavobacterium sp. TaxID=239 RepID=UPI002FDA318B|nr:alpha/beta hydrolase [Bacteroidota bacterium]
MINSKTIVFIHGLHENSHSWIEWKSFFENLGYNCYTFNYPYHEGIPLMLRQKPNKLLTDICLNDVVEHYYKIIDLLENKSPILIGHSMGGLIVQKLIQKQKGSLGICITSAPPKGVFSFKWSFIKSNIGVVNPFKGNGLYCGTKKWYHYAICNTLTREQSDEIYEKAVVPESRRIPRTSRQKDGKIDFNKPHNPLLFIGAEKDHILPISLIIKNYKAYKNKQSIADFKEFQGFSHSICVQNGWQKVAQYIEEWIKKNI